MVNLIVKKEQQLLEEHKAYFLENCILSGKELPDIYEEVAINELLFLLDTREPPVGAIRRVVQKYQPLHNIKHNSIPRGISLDPVMLELKSRIPKSKQHLKATELYGDKLTLLQKIKKQNTYRKLGELQKYADKIPKQAKTIFYCGEHIDLTHMDAYWKLVKQKDPAMQFLGGYRLASGYEFYTEGNIKAAHEQFALLANIFKKLDPGLIIAPSWATYFTLRKIRHLYNLSYKVMYFSKWATQMQHHLKNLPKDIAVYHNPQVKSYSSATLQQIIKPPTILHDVDRNRNIPLWEYLHEQDEATKTRRHNIIADAKSKAELLIVDCPKSAEILKKEITKNNQLEILHIAEFLQKFENE